MNREILELIEPFMDKTTSFWCIIKWYSTWEYGIIERMAFDTWLDFRAIWKDHELCLSHCEILWHYDITAVLKYFQKNWYSEQTYHTFRDSLDIITIKIQVWWSWEYYEIPQKPLHLYTEQEQKDLLELLLKLKD